MFLIFIAGVDIEQILLHWRKLIIFFPIHLSSIYYVSGLFLQQFYHIATDGPQLVLQFLVLGQFAWLTEVTVVEIKPCKTGKFIGCATKDTGGSCLLLHMDKRRKSTKRKINYYGNLSRYDEIHDVNALMSWEPLTPWSLSWLVLVFFISCPLNRHQQNVCVYLN